MRDADARANTTGQRVRGYTRSALRLTLFTMLMTLQTACSEEKTSVSVPPDSGPAIDAGAASDGAIAPSDAGDGADSVMPVEATYYQHVKPILDTHCMHCHTPGGAGDFDLGSYELAKMWAPAIVEATQSRRMPPWGAFDTEDCQPSRPWVDDQRLSDEELAILSNWNALGAPEGDADNPVAGAPFVANQLGRIDYEGRAGAPVDVPAGQDSFICVVIDPNLTEETWIKGFEFVPDNEALVHHVVLFTDPTRASLDRADETGTYPCFGSAGVPGSVAAAWAPGIQPTSFPEDHAMRIAPGTLFVMQMHYSPQGGAGELNDQTTLRFEYADEPPKYEVLLQLMGNFGFTVHPGLGLQPDATEQQDGSRPRFVIPAGADEHYELLRWTYSGDLPGTFDGGGADGLNRLKLLSVSPHMHYAGVDMRVSIDRPAYGEAACESGTLNNFFGCANREGCLSEENAIACLQDKCADEWSQLSLTCWGCAQGVFVGDGGIPEAIARINACEQPSEARMSFPEEPARECLVSAPKYNFEWQRAYAYDVPLDKLPTMMPGDVLSIECRYQNTLDNPLMREALGRAGESEPGVVRLGDETLDEMCLVGLLFAFERAE